jgi:serine/arginine repetitive matrix protein 2
MSCPISEDVHNPLHAPPNTTTGSIAIRAMRSMRSVARLANWSNGKTMEKDTTLSRLPMKKHKQPADVKRSRKKEKGKFNSERDQTTLRLSSGGSEAGAVAITNTAPVQASTTRKHGVLGLGFPSGFRFGTVRSSSAGSSSQIPPGFNNTTSFDSRGRSSSMVSAISSLMPTSAKSRVSSSSSAPVKWVEECPETVKVACRRDRLAEQRDGSSKEARHQGAIADMFLKYPSSPASSTLGASVPRPILTTKATSGGVLRSELMATPYAQTRVRPASDQMIDKERLRCIRHAPDGES